METRKTRVDRYREILERKAFAELRPKLDDLDRTLQFREPGSREPSILQEELEEVRTLGERDRGESGLRRPDLLVLSVGTSSEPLLLATAYHRPGEVVLLVEERLTPATVERLEELWSYHHELVGSPFPETSRRMVRDQPAHVFRELRNLLEGRAELGEGRVVVDVTGGKKSMVAGAFLAAGFLGVETSYVDFAEYDSILRRPIPGTVQPGRLQHPEHLFRLREEKRLEEAFDERRFDEAVWLAQNLTDMARTPAVVEILGEGQAAELGERYETTARVARAYALWSRGFYVEARAELEAAGDVPVPPTVAALSIKWPRKDVAAHEIPEMLKPEELTADPALVPAYFLDVLVWMEEAYLQRRPREGFLRLYGAWEALVFYLFEVFVGRDPERLDVRAQDPEAELPGDWTQEGRRTALDVGRESSRVALKILKGKETTLKIGEGAEVTVRLEPPAIEAKLAKRLFEKKIGEAKLGHFVLLRHKATHWLAPVPRAAAAWLRDFFVRLVLALIPLAVRHLEEGQLRDDPAGRVSLRESSERLLDAARGHIPDDCRPLTHAQLLERIQTGERGA